MSLQYDSMTRRRDYYAEPVALFQIEADVKANSAKPAKTDELYSLEQGNIGANSSVVLVRLIFAPESLITVEKNAKKPPTLRLIILTDKKADNSFVKKVVRVLEKYSFASVTVIAERKDITGKLVVYCHKKQDMGSPKQDGGDSLKRDLKGSQKDDSDKPSSPVGSYQLPKSPISSSIDPNSP